MSEPVKWVGFVAVIFGSLWYIDSIALTVGLAFGWVYLTDMEVWSDEF